MKNLLFSYATFFLMITLPLKGSGQQFAKSFRGTTEHDDNGHAIARDGLGNIYLCGSFRTTVDFDPDTLLTHFMTADNANTSNQALFLGKYSPNGELIWVKKVVSSGIIDQNIAYGVDIDQDTNVYITGTFQGINVDFDPGPGTSYLTSSGGYDIFLAKYDSKGNFNWANSIGGVGSDKGRAIKTDGTGNLYITGTFSGTSIDFDPGVGTCPLSSNGSTDIFLTSFTSAGAFRWAKSFGGNYLDEGLTIELDNSGTNVYVGGTFSSLANVDFDPGPGTAFMSSSRNTTSDGFIVKFSSNNGNFQWVFKIGSTSGSLQSESVTSIAVDTSDNLYICGEISSDSSIDFDPGTGTVLLTKIGTKDAYFAKYSLSGSLIWAKNIGTIASNVVPHAIYVEDSKVFVSGQFTNTLNFDPDGGGENATSSGSLDIFFAKYNASDGSFYCKGTVGGPSIDNGNAVISDGTGSGSFYVFGWFRGINVDFDPLSGGTYVLSSGVSGGFSDVFLGKYGTSCSMATPLSVDKTTLTSYCEEDHTIVDWSNTSNQNKSEITLEYKLHDLKWLPVENQVIPQHETTDTPYRYIFQIPPYLANNPKPILLRVQSKHNDETITYSDVIPMKKCRIDQEYLEAFPNPVTGNFNIHWTGERSNFRFAEIYNTMGEKIMIIHDPEATINLSGHSKGIYFIHWYTINKSDLQLLKIILL